MPESTGGRLRAWAVTLAVVGLGCAAPSLASGAGISSHENGLIAFVSSSCPCLYSETVYLTDEYGTVTKTLRSGIRPAFSPDGVHIAYVGPLSSVPDPTFGIHVTDITGDTGAKDLGLVPGEGGTPSWMPDGTHVVFPSANAVKEADLWGNVRTLFSVAPLPGTTTLNIEDASVSADGARIAMTLPTIATSTHTHTEIFVANIDGSNLHQVTTTPFTPPPPSENGFDGAYAAHWSPDGTRLAFTFTPAFAPPSLERIATVSPNGGTPTVLPFGAPTADAAFSPDGTQIVFDTAHGLARANTDGSGEQPIPAGPSQPVNGIAPPVSPGPLGVGGSEPTWGPVPNCAILTPYLAAYTNFNVGACVNATLG